MLLVSLISYMDRTTLALLAPTILKECGLTGEQYGFIISAFSVAYMLSNPLWGWVLDRAGLRRGMSVAVACWTVASAAHAFASGFWSFAVARAALGLGEGATFPGGLRTVVQTLPPEQRGRGLAVSYSGGSLGAVITPLIVTPVFLWWGWRAAFWFTGIIGAAWIVLWAIVSRRADIAAPHRALVETKAARAPRIGDPALWAFMSAYALGALPLGFVLYSAALYLAHPLGKSQEFIGKVLWLPPLGWEIGYFFWGSLCDRAARRRAPGALRAMLTGCVLLNAGIAAVPFVSHAGAVMALLSLAMFVASGFVVLSVSYATSVYSSAHAGVIAGAGAGSWSLLVAIAMPWFGRLFDQHRYASAFWIAGAVPIAGYLGWLLLSPRDRAEVRF
jgi:ACS family hexuronate transporter-like MFS transporter